jgi:hypothetical protein
MPCEEAQAGAFGGEGLGYVMADKTGGACEEDVHGLESLTSS